MQRLFDRLKERVSLLGNHHQKFIRTIDKHGWLLIERLEDKGLIDKVHLWKSAYNYSEEMDIVTAVAKDFREKSIFLGCYYAFQILHLNLRSVDVLRWNLTTTDDKISVYKQFMLDVGKEFRQLTSAYMEKVINLLFEDKPIPEFTICSVGSLAHQDDIDIGIIDDGSVQRAELNKIIGKLRHEMFRWAVEMHMYLSEHVGEQNYSASVEEYKELLDHEIGDFVMISEMLIAVPILGSKRLFAEFGRKVTSRYYYHPRRDNKYHEGYLRGILGEVRSLLLRQISEDMLNPKDDALRMLMGMTLAGRTIFRVYRGNRWDVLATLKQRDPGRKEIYQKLEDALTFLEVFRHLYQLLIAEEEEIYLDEPSITEQMQIVAKTLGYKDVGAIKAWDHLLIHYHEYVQKAKEVTSELLEDVTQHLKSISIFTPIIKGTWESEKYRSYAGNIAIDFLKKSAFFRQTKFWNDILEALEDEKGHVLENFIKDLRAIPPRFQKLIIEKYCEAAEKSFYTMIYFLVLLAKNKRKLSCEQFIKRFKKRFLDHITQGENHIVRLTKVFHQYPKLINDFLMILTAEEQEKFLHLIEGKLWSKEEAASKEKLEHLCKLHYSNSHYFKRFFVRVISNYPEYIQYLQDTVALHQIAKGFLGSIDNLPSFKDKKKHLGNYYDLEFLRVGLETINGASIDKINSEFTEFSDTYLQALFDVCKKCVDEEIGKTISTRDLFAIFLTGGHAREQAFDDDYDIIMFLNDTDPELHKYVTRIVQKMNTEIIKRGTMPHYRFADKFGHFVTLVHDLDVYFSTHDNDDVFIDKSQILGSRMVVGSTKFEKDFNQQIVIPHIFNKNEIYIKQMIREMKSRHRDLQTLHNGNRNIKEAIGGLRDIEMVLLMYKAKYKLRDPINQKLLLTLCKNNPDYKNKFCRLGRAFNFLKNLRDLYRLTVSAEDNLNVEYLDRVAHIMGFKDNNNASATEQLIAKYQQEIVEVHKIIESLIEEFER